MDRAAPEYSQTGLPSPYPSTFGDAPSEGSSAEHPAAAAQYPPVQKDSSYPASATPTSEYGVYPTSARSGSFPEPGQRSYHPAGNSSSGGMAQQHNPSIAAPSPTYPYGQHSPYAPNPDMSHGYPHPSGGMYGQPRPEWGAYGQHGPPMTPGGHPVYAQGGQPPQQRPSQVYSFVPIPGAQQHKRPRRRYEEIERMYKCGFQGCEKAYGTLNHLNAHVTMQSHGQKRTPEEFKEIRKEWKARKKEEDAQRKAEEERQRATGEAHEPPSSYPGSRPVQLPPIGYSHQYPAPPSGQPPMQEYGGSHMYSSYQPHSPYGAQNLYNQSNGSQAPSH
ncbi:Putative Transcriptional regulator [[Torrubiella] hemipterigena]|uniref:Putative Transcriptional regulator n=1 Tax=[Torrubiella] hemipterigena TaxID=1531966 RepID=A0A0A1TL01_9HYPO|nr:Putative Transcriptional regulator [[Torrubiella] hemipterigena]